MPAQNRSSVLNIACSLPITLEMLRCIAISPNEPLGQELATALAKFPEVELVRAFPNYPTLDDLLRTIRVRKPDFLFLCIEELSQIEALAAHLDDLLPDFPIVALGMI
jgi:hypothetical protein